MLMLVNIFNTSSGEKMEYTNIRKRRRKLKNKKEEKRENCLELPPFLQKKLNGIERKLDMVKP